MIRLSPDGLIGTASAFLGRGASGGPTDLDGRPVDVALLELWGFWSHYDHRTDQSSWPVAPAHTAAELGAFGTERGVLRDEPQRGDIFLQYAPRRRTFVHAGVVVRVRGRGQLGPRQSYVDLLTIEGDTDALGRLGGGMTLRLARRLWPSAGDRFLRWVDLPEPGYATACGAYQEAA